MSPPGTTNPFAELDGLYNQIFSCVDDIKLTLHVLSLYTAAPRLATQLRRTSDVSVELLLSVEEGDIDLALINLSSIVSYNESSGKLKILHASLVDFLSDKHRSNELYIDMASSHSDFACRILQYVKGPDGIRAGDFVLFGAGFQWGGWIRCNGQHGSEILNFDFDAFITAAIKNRYKKHSECYYTVNVIVAFPTWINTLDNAGFEDGDKQDALDRCKNSLESWVQKYQTDSRLQLLLTLATVMDYGDLLERVDEGYRIPKCRRLDILLEMDDHDIHLVDQDALDLRHNHNAAPLVGFPQQIDITPLYIDGDRYTSAALRCMSFLSSPPKYSNTNERSLTKREWQVTCDMALDLLCKLLDRANPSLELIQFMSNHDIDSAVRKNCSAICAWVDAHILAFLSHANICVNWRIISAVRTALFATDEWPSESEENDGSPEEREDTEITRRLMEQRCCDHCYVDTIV